MTSAPRLNRNPRNAGSIKARPLFHGFSGGRARSRPALAALTLACAALLLSAPHAVAAHAPADTLVERSGTLPAQGRAVIRSGMAWMDETAPIFQKISTEFAKELTGRGLAVIQASASALEPMPKTPLPNKQAARDVPARRQAAPSEPGAAEGAAAQKAQELGKDGKLPPLKLRTYMTADKDKDLPESVRAIAAPDVTRALYARSQQAGKPVVQSFAIPGRLPGELSDDAKKADYAFIIRFAAVRAWAESPAGEYPEAPGNLWAEALDLAREARGRDDSPFGPGVPVAASTIGGTARLGIGEPAQAAPPGQNTYGTPGGYARGYEGSSRNDTWHRDSDFYQRDYQFKHGPQPQHATPPSGLSGSVTGKGPVQQRGFGATPLPGRSHGASFIGWHLLILECFDLAPAREGKKPVRVWQATVRSPGGGDDFGATLPKMVRAAFAATQN